jgi:hypothetical protein
MRNGLADRGVTGKIEFAAPAVGLEAQRDRGACGSREDRAGVAQPDVAIERRHDLGRIAELGAGRGLGFSRCRQEPHPV